MKICIEVKTPKRMKALSKFYGCKEVFLFKGEDDCCLDILTGKCQPKPYFEGYKILSYKEWKSIIKHQKED